MRILETPRLYLREMKESDAKSAYELNLDPDVIRYTGDVAFKSIEEARAFLINYNHYEKYGFGRWAVIRKSDEVFLGWCGLKYTPEHEEYDIGYRLMKRYWGEGYATEAAQACVEWGLDNIDLEGVVGRVAEGNRGSIKVLEKIGLKYQNVRRNGNERLLIYEIRRDEFTRLHMR